MSAEPMRYVCKCCGDLIDEQYINLSNWTCNNCNNLYALDGLDLERMQQSEKDKEMSLLLLKF